MGSLEQIHSQMGGLRNLNIGIINNISTALAVDIGLGICGNQKLEDILKRASESNVCTYRIIHNVQKGSSRSRKVLNRLYKLKRR